MSLTSGCFTIDGQESTDIFSSQVIRFTETNMLGLLSRSGYMMEPEVTRT